MHTMKHVDEIFYPALQQENKKLQEEIERLKGSVYNLIRENQFLRDQISRLEKERD
jgi:peptidoglycan hydrolase CwlO-like protein